MLLFNKVLIVTSNHSKNCKSLYEVKEISTHHPEQPGCELDTKQVAVYTRIPWRTVCPQ